MATLISSIVDMVSKVFPQAHLTSDFRYFGWISGFIGLSLPPYSRIHRVEKILVGLRLGYLVEEELHALRGGQRGEEFPQDPDSLENGLFEQELFLSRPGLVDVDGREDPLLRDFPVEDEFHVPRPLELLEDDLVHPAARLAQRLRPSRCAACRLLPRAARR